MENNKNFDVESILEQLLTEDEELVSISMVDKPC